jgi:hypothetical protein
LTVKKLALPGLAVVVVVGAVLVFGFGQNQDNPAGDASQQAPSAIQPPGTPKNTDKKMTVDAANKMAAKLVSSDRAVYGSVWAHDNVPPNAPKNTKVTIDVSSMRSYKTLGQVYAVVSVPGKSPVKVVMYMELIAGQWLIHRLEEVK